MRVRVGTTDSNNTTQGSCLTQFELIHADRLNAETNMKRKPLKAIRNSLEDEINSMHRSMYPIFFAAQCFGLFPVQKISSQNTYDLRFTWRSVRVLYSIAVVILQVAEIVFTIAWFLIVGFSFENAGAIMFPSTGMLCCILFFKLARNWPKLAALWQEAECSQLHYGYPKNLRRKCSTLAAVVFTIAVVENGLANYTSITVAASCATDKFDLIRRYYKWNHKHVFEVIKFNPYAAVFASVSNILATFYWSFADLFIMLMGIALASRFRLLNNHLKNFKGKMMTEEFWRGVREDYNNLSFLTKNLDTNISSIILLSFATNLFYICQQLLNTLKQTRSLVPTLYFYVSFSYLALRTIAMGIYVSAVNEESRVPKGVLYFVPPDTYYTEVHRFLFQITTDDVALTGLNFFPVTRTVLLTLAGTIVTYEVVLVQFGSISQGTINNITALCLNLTEKD